MARPTALPIWTSDGAGTKQTQPPAGQITTGWVLNQKMPFRYLNWLFYQITLWINWLSASTNGQTSVTTTATVDGVTRTYLCDPTGGAFTVTLPAAASTSAGYRVTLKNKAIGSANNVTIARTGADLIEGGTSATLTQGDYLDFECDGVSNWWMVGGI